MPDPKKITDWRDEYKESLVGWKESLNSVQEHFASIIKKSWAKASYIVRNLPMSPDKMVICPPHSALNMAPNQQHRGDYATGIFEGSSAEPQLDSDGKIVGVNAVLHGPRMKRFARSLATRGYSLAMPLERFAQSTLDIIAVEGLKILTNDDSSPTRAYVRPAAGPGVGTWGVSFKPGYFIESSNFAFRWGHYLEDVERVYYKEGARVAITGLRRLFPIKGKHASNYGAAATDGNLARAMKYDELIYLAPYGIRDGELDYNLTSLEDIFRYGAITDGPGEEVFGLLDDEETLVYAPMRSNRLGGTVLQYIIDHMATALGLKIIERDMSLEDIRKGKIIALGYAGNAAKIVPIGKVDLVKPIEESNEGKIVETLADWGVHPVIARIRDQWQDELNGRKPASHASLLTPIDLEWGKVMKSYLDEYWSKMGFDQLVG